jgi:hypothetical protein
VNRATATAPAPRPSEAAAPTGAGCHPTPDQVAAANKLLEDTRSAISPRYASVSAAALDNFQPAANDNSTYSRVIHYGSDANWWDRRTPDPEHPEGLLYGRTDHHGVVLLGAFYMAQFGEAGPDVAGCLTPWHVHQAGARAMLHVWIVDMAGGPFANDWDPSYIANL